MVKAGESSGMLDEILDRLAAYLEKTSALQKKISSALIYPAVVSGMAAGITLLLLLKVIPIFKDIFSGFGSALPKPTMILIAISDAIRHYFILIVIVTGAICAMVMRFVKTEKGRLAWDSLLLRMPIFGVLFQKVAISKFTRK